MFSERYALLCVELVSCEVLGGVKKNRQGNEEIRELCNVDGQGGEGRVMCQQDQWLENALLTVLNCGSSRHMELHKMLEKKVTPL